MTRFTGEEPDPLAEVQEGDPDTIDRGEWSCGAIGPGVWWCSRPPRHPGKHIAGNGEYVLRVWARE